MCECAAKNAVLDRDGDRILHRARLNICVARALDKEVLVARVTQCIIPVNAINFLHSLLPR